MLSTTEVVALPNWQHNKTIRLGASFRLNPERFIFIKNHGWFFFIRSELNAISGLISCSGVLGPFDDLEVAQGHLSDYLLMQPE